VAPSGVRTEEFAYYSPPVPKQTRGALKDQFGKLGFAIRPINGHVRFTWSDGKWDKGVFVPSPYQLMHINAGVLHYGISVFEGMKAFAGGDGKIRLMNPTLNAKRMQEGADALLMPQVPIDLFVNGVKEAVRRNRDFVPPFGHGAALYIRPLLFASGPMLGLAPLASEYTFFVTVTPTGGYFGKDGVEKGVKALVSEDHDRAAPKGTGGVKAGGNYAADLAPVHGAHKQGFQTTLYLDAKERKYIEEFSVCNFVGITKDNKYVTPKSDTILRSTTNRMLQQLAKDRGMVVEERPILLEELSEFKEVGMVGTAAVVVRVDCITYGEKTWEFNTFDTISSIREVFLRIQTGQAEDKHNWMVEIGDVVDDESEVQMPTLEIESFTPGMVHAKDKGVCEMIGSQALERLESRLLEHVLNDVQPGSIDSVLASMDTFWNQVYEHQAGDEWAERAQIIEDAVLEKVTMKAGSNEPVRCLELGTYCGYSSLLIAKHLPEGSVLASVEKNPLFAAIATKIVELAGAEKKVKIWIGTAQSELKNLSSQLGGKPADFVLVDHDQDKFVSDLKLLQDQGVITNNTSVLGDTDVYPGDEPLDPNVQEEISVYFERSPAFMIAHDSRFIPI
jgi:branched-chain amino acid aminotransferase